MTAPLDGVVVVALEQAVASPLATRHLADLGATVLKIERPDGGDLARHYDAKVLGESAYFVWANRGKHSVVLDLKQPVDRQTFDRLIAGADVFIQNLSPAAAGRLRVRPDQLRADHPSLIACEISGYGGGGPRTDDKAYDLAIQAEAGAISVTGSDSEMSKVGFSAADIAAAMYALGSILAALVRRARTGEGASIEVSMLEALTEWNAPAVYAAAHTGTVPERVGHRHAAIAPYGLYALADGNQVMVAVQAHHEWVAFASEVLGDERLADDPRFATNEARIDNIGELEAEMNAVFGTEQPAEIRRRLRDARVAHAGVRDLLEVWEHEQHHSRGHHAPLSTPGGDTTNFRSPFRIDAMPDPPDRVPALGEHDPAVVDAILERGEGG